MTRYSGGVDFEREVKRHLEQDGYWVIRAAGSKGKADLVAIKDNQVLIVQCKRNGLCPPAERNEVRRIAALLPGVAIPLVAGRPGITLRRLTGPAASAWEPFTTDEVTT